MCCGLKKLTLDYSRDARTRENAPCLQLQELGSISAGIRCDTAKRTLLEQVLRIVQH